MNEIRKDHAEGPPECVQCNPHPCLVRTLRPRAEDLPKSLQRRSRAKLKLLISELSFKSTPSEHQLKALCVLPGRAEQIRGQRKVASVVATSRPPDTALIPAGVSSSRGQGCLRRPLRVGLPAGDGQRLQRPAAGTWLVSTGLCAPCGQLNTTCGGVPAAWGGAGRPPGRARRPLPACQTCHRRHCWLRTAAPH